MDARKTIRERIYLPKLFSPSGHGKPYSALRLDASTLEDMDENDNKQKVILLRKED